MAYQTPITIGDALERIHRHELVLPAIQREFVWRPRQIAALFDSLMRGYPIGAFLFWHVAADRTGDYKFYDFVRRYHQRDNPHCPQLGAPPSAGVTAVLDGQQRLTALNIGLRGSHAEKEPRKWWNNPDAFPRKWLHLNLLRLRDTERNEDGLKYDFRFLTEEQATRRDEETYWFRVGDVWGMKNAVDLFRYLQERDLTGNEVSFPLLEKLHTVVHKEGIISFYEERDQDPDKVLNIFIRTNSGGTQLSYSDLLLSIATAQWERLDARSAIHELVDELNGTRFGFSFSKDFVLKAGLMLADVASVGFKVTNFNRANMSVLEEAWEGIADALRLTVRLVASFGFSGKTLGADSALLPVAYYLHRRGAGVSYLKSQHTLEDRQTIREWLVRSLLKSGVWGSGLDTLLTQIRAAIREADGDRFPAEAVEAAMARRGRSLVFAEEEVEELLDVGYGDRRAFALLATLYPFVDLRDEFHVDHIFPRRLFTKSALARTDVPAERADEFKAMADRLPNLQLLQGRLNESKGGQQPAAWLLAQFPDMGARQGYIARHDLGEVPRGVDGFERFFEARRAAMRTRLLAALQQPLVDADGVD